MFYSNIFLLAITCKRPKETCPKNIFEPADNYLENSKLTPNDLI